MKLPFLQWSTVHGLSCGHTITNKVHHQYFMLSIGIRKCCRLRAGCSVQSVSFFCLVRSF